MANKIATVVSILLLIFLVAIPIIYREEAKKAAEEEQKQQQQNNQEQKEQTQTEPPPLNYNLSDVTLVGHTDGTKQWELNVKGVTDEGKQTTTLLNLKDGELFQSGKTRFFLSAETGEYDRQRDQFSLSNNVLLKGVQGEIIKTNELFYDNVTHQVRSGPVDLENDNSKVRAGQMKIDVDNEVFEFENGFEMEFTIEDGEEVEPTEGQNGGVEDVKSQDM
jgi:LPS export ABC transporter protein LptC